MYQLVGIFSALLGIIFTKIRVERQSITVAFFYRETGEV